MHMHEFLKALPKVSLHVHLMGSVQAQTAVDLLTFTLAGSAREGDDDP